MLRGFEALDSRIHTTHGLRCIEPPGQGKATRRVAWLGREEKLVAIIFNLYALWTTRFGQTDAAAAPELTDLTALVPGTHMEVNCTD